MKNTVFANLRGIVHKGSNGMSTVFPDVCLTPVPSAPPTPIPYPNIGRSADTANGPQTVTVSGKMPMVKGASYSKTSGDEAGTNGGVACGVNRGAAEFMVYSFDVKIEGDGVCRLGDALFHNRKNAVG